MQEKIGKLERYVVISSILLLLLQNTVIIMKKKTGLYRYIFGLKLDRANRAPLRVLYTNLYSISSFLSCLYFITKLKVVTIKQSVNRKNMSREEICWYRQLL